MAGLSDLKMGLLESILEKRYDTPMEDEPPDAMFYPSQRVEDLPGPELLPEMKPPKKPGILPFLQRMIPGGRTGREEPGQYSTATEEDLSYEGESPSPYEDYLSDEGESPSPSEDYIPFRERFTDEMLESAPVDKTLANDRYLKLEMDLRKNALFDPDSGYVSQAGPEEKSKEEYYGDDYMLSPQIWQRIKDANHLFYKKFPKARDAYMEYTNIPGIEKDEEGNWKRKGIEAQKGRGGDTEIRKVDGQDSHVNAFEAWLIDKYGAKGEEIVKDIGSGTINPETGLPEYISFKNLFNPTKWKIGKHGANYAERMATKGAKKVMRGGLSNLLGETEQFLGGGGFLERETALKRDELVGGTTTELGKVKSGVEGAYAKAGFATSGEIESEQEKLESGLLTDYGRGIEGINLGAEKAEVEYISNIRRQTNKLLGDYLSATGEGYDTGSSQYQDLMGLLEGYEGG